MTRDELRVMVYENTRDIPKWFRGKDIAGYIIDTELNLVICEMKHLEFLRMLKALAIHNIPIDIDLIDKIERLSNEKVKV